METTQLLKVSTKMLSCCASLSPHVEHLCARTHTHERTLANTYIATHPFSHARIRTRTLARSHARTPAPTHAYIHTRSFAGTNARTHARTQARKNTRTHARSFSRTHPRTILALAPRNAHLYARTHARTRARMHGSTHVSMHPCWLARTTHAHFAVSLSPTFVFLSSLLMYNRCTLLMYNRCTLLMYNRCTVDELQLFCRGVNYSLLSHYSPDVSVIVWLAEPLQNHTIRRHQPPSTNVTLFEYYSYNLRRGVTSQDYRYLIYPFKICVLPLTYSMWIHFHDTNITSTQ